MHFLFTHFPPDIWRSPGLPRVCADIARLCGFRRALCGVRKELRVLPLRHAEDPICRVVIRVRRLAHAQTHARELVGTQGGDDALQAVVPARAAARAYAQAARRQGHLV